MERHICDDTSWIISSGGVVFCECSFVIVGNTKMNKNSPMWEGLSYVILFLGLAFYLWISEGSMKNTNEGSLLKRLRKEKGLSQKHIGNAINRHPQMIFNIESGRVSIPIKLIKPLAKALGCDKEILIEAKINDFKNYCLRKVGK